MHWQRDRWFAHSRCSFPVRLDQVERLVRRFFEGAAFFSRDCFRTAAQNAFSGKPFPSRMLCLDRLRSAWNRGERPSKSRSKSSSSYARLLGSLGQTGDNMQQLEAASPRRTAIQPWEKRRVLRILFLCTGNSCRSQMAEGWARSLKAGRIEPYSAGIEAHGLNADAVRVMAEAGVDISTHYSKRLEALRGSPAA
jgi:hypothetical protein